MFKKIFLSVCLFILILVIVSSFIEFKKNNPPAILENIYRANPELLPKIKPLSVKEGVYLPGRKLVLGIKYMNIIPIGEAVLSIGKLEKYNGVKVYPLAAEATVGKFSEIFYKAKVRVESLVNAQTLLPLLYKEEMYEKGELNRSKQIEFDQDRLLMVRDGNIKRKIVPSTFDPVSSIFYLRSQDFDAHKSSKIMMISKEDIYVMKTTVLGKNNNIWHLDSSISRLSGSSTHGSRFLMWLGADSNRLPLLIKVSTKAGPFTARLIEIK
ncbi:MAG: DUF3108 domain-containing protein [Candidatus Omnitrophota bacterium]